MKAFRFIFAVAAMACCLSASAADDNGKDEYEFQKHWFLNVQGGAQYTLGEAAFGDLLSPNVQLGLGYQFNPWFGARLAVNAWQSKGGWNDQQNNTYKFKYVAPGVDAMFNLSNLIWGYNPKRTVSVSAFAGIAANIAFSNDEANTLVNNGALMEYIWDGTKVRPAARAGVAVDFRLSDAVSLGIEGNANTLSDKYNSKKAGNSDWYFNALVGLKFNLGKTYTVKQKPAPEPAPVVVPEPKPEPKPQPKPEPVVEKKVEMPRCEVFFEINKSIVVAQEEAKLEEIAKFLNENPNAKVSVTGYADKGTGNAKINSRLANERAAAVAAILANKGIAADRIVSDSKGDTVQPYAENDKNRVTICVVK